METNIELISDLTTANLKCDSIKGGVTIGLDCEGVSLGPNGEITLIQLLHSDSKVFLFDVLACPNILKCGKLRNILEDPTILKVIHDFRGDRVNLKNQFGIQLDPVFDTQIAYKFTHTGDHDRRIGWNKLCEKFQVPRNPLKAEFHGIFAINKAFWKTRPLTTKMIEYAAGDVVHLLGLHARLNSKIKAYDRAGFEKECREATIGGDGGSRYF